MFSTSIPVTSDTFHDRVEELDRLGNLIQGLLADSPSWTAIIGSRKVGKTSLLMELAHRHRQSGVRFVVMDVLETHPVTLEFFRHYALVVVDELLGRELGCSLRFLAHRPEEFRAAVLRSVSFARLEPALRTTIMELPERNPDEEMVREVLDLPEQLARALDHRVLIALDEFQELAFLSSGRGAVDLLPLIRSIWQRHQRVAYVVSGSARTMLTEKVTDRRSPFFQHFSVMELGPFSSKDAVRLLVQGGPAGRTIPDILARRAVEVIGGHPFYVQLLGEALTSGPPPYTERHLQEALQQLMFSRSGRLALYFDREFHRLVGRSTYLAAILEALSEGPRRFTDIARTIGAASGATARYLERLDRALHHREDGLYELNDRAFSLWLQWRQPGGSVTPMKVIGDEAEVQVADHLARMGFDLVYQSRGSRGSFDLLATRGSTQLGVQVKRSDPPLRFSKTAWNRMTADAVRFSWHWVLAAVSRNGEVTVHDPGKARQGKEIRLAGDSIIENLLEWLDRLK